ncbi:MAG: phosphotransferase family protein [Ilumatobacteraceae bacterium]
MAEDLPGYDRAAVERWVGEHVEGLVPPFQWRRLEGGHSNLTFALTDTEGRDAVIRRPPLGKLLPKAHDMWREYRIIAALGPTAVPVPVAYGFCEDESVTGAKFYVMSRVTGRALYTLADVEEHVPVENRPRLAESFIDTLAALHSVDPESVGLADLGRPDGYVARQLKTWYGSWTASAEGAQYDDARIHELHEHFSTNLPEQGPGRIVHGDYGPHNVMTASEGRVTAVLDWEIATLGDPLADMAYALNAWVSKDEAERRGMPTVAATSAEGFPSSEVLAERYAASTGADLSNLAYYRAFNYFKTACIIHGVYCRYVLGQKSSDGVDLPLLKARIADSIQAASAAVGMG